MTLGYNGGGLSPTVPTPPTYQAPPVYTSPGAYNSLGSYTNPGASQAMPTANSANSVQNSGQVMGQAYATDQSLPQALRITTDPTDPAAMAAYQKSYYNQYLNPAIQQSLAADYQGNPGGGSTFGDAVAGQAIANGATDWNLASQQYATNNLNNQLAQRASYFGNEGAMSQQQANALVSARQADQGLGTQQANDINQYNLQNSQNQNQYNLQQAQQLNQYNLNSAQMANNYGLGSTQMKNTFDLGNYNNQLGQYGAQAQNAQTAGQNYGMLANGIVGGAAAIGNAMGIGGGPGGVNLGLPSSGSGTGVWNFGNQPTF